MDNLTQSRILDADAHARASDWLRAAMGSVAVCAPDQAILPSEQTWSAELVKNTVRPRQRHRTSLHRHGYMEVCISVGGRGLIEVADHMALLHPPRIFFALPHTPHCQASTPEGDSHALVWLTVTGDEMLVINSMYRSPGGWSGPAPASLQGEDVRQLSDDLQAMTADPTPHGLEATRADMLQVINRLYQQLVRRERRDAADSPQDHHEPVLKYVRAYIENNLDTHVTLRELGEMARLSPNYLNRLFKQWTGQPLHQYTIRRRMETAMQMLRNGRRLVKQVARRVGYEDPLYFSRAFHEYYGQWPSEIGDQS